MKLHVAYMTRGNNTWQKHGKTRQKEKEDLLHVLQRTKHRQYNQLSTINCVLHWGKKTEPVSVSLM